jgi:hypothetical protein
VFSVIFPGLLKFSPVFLKDLSWDPCSLMCLLTTYVMQLPTLSIYILLMISKSSIVVKSPQDCNLLQADINSVQGWCIASCMKLNISKTEVMCFSGKTNVLIYDCNFCQSSITRTDSVKDLVIFIDTKLHFLSHVNLFFFIALRRWA